MFSVLFYNLRQPPLPPATVAMVAVGGGAFCDLNKSPCMLRVGFILVCCCYLNVICSYMSLNLVPVVSRFSGKFLPPPATVTMVAGGGDLIIYPLVSHVY